jgi:hypothetical protein
MISSLIHLVLYIFVLGLVIGLLIYLLDQVAQYMPEPFYRVGRILIIVVGVLILILLLLSVIGEGGRLPRLM